MRNILTFTILIDGWDNLFPERLWIPHHPPSSVPEGSYSASAGEWKPYLALNFGLHSKTHGSRNGVRSPRRILGLFLYNPFTEREVKANEKSIFVHFYRVFGLR